MESRSENIDRGSNEEFQKEVNRRKWPNNSSTTKLKYIFLQIGRICQMPSLADENQAPRPWHINVKFQNNGDKENLLQTSRERGKSYIKKMVNQQTSDVSKQH